MSKRSITTVGEMKQVLDCYDDDSPIIFLDHPDSGWRPSLVSTINDHDSRAAAREFSFQPGTDVVKNYVVFSTMIVGDTRQFSYEGEPIASWPGRRS